MHNAECGGVKKQEKCLISYASDLVMPVTNRPSTCYRPLAPIESKKHREEDKTG